MSAQLSKWLSAGIVEKCVSEWGSPLFVVWKNGKPRHVIDYRQANRFIEKDSFPLPNIQSNLDKLAGSKYYSVLDATAAFHAVSIDQDSREYTSFICSKGQFRFTKLPFGFSNGPALYSRLLQKLLTHIDSPNIMGYLDDLILHLADTQSMLDTLDKTLMAHAEFGLKLNPSKSEIFRTEVIYLGHLCSRDGVRMVPKYRKVLEDWEKTHNTIRIEKFYW